MEIVQESRGPASRPGAAASRKLVAELGAHAATPGAERHQWAFAPLPVQESGLLASREHRDTLMRWGLDQTLILEKFRVTAGGKDLAANPDAAVLDFFNSPEVQAQLARACATPERAALRRPSGQYHSVQSEPLRTDIVDLSFLRRLKESEHRIVSESGYLRKCPEEIYDGATSATLLTDMLLNEESEHADTYSSQEQSELIFRLFRWLAVGGALCQSDDKLQPYTDMLKVLYKELVHVVKDAETQKLQVTSRPFLITGLDQSDKDLFARSDNMHNFALLIFHPRQYTVTFMSSSFIPFL